MLTNHLDAISFKLPVYCHDRDLKSLGGCDDETVTRIAVVRGQKRRVRTKLQIKNHFGKLISLRHSTDPHIRGKRQL